MLFFLMPEQRSMVPISSGALFTLKRLVLWLLWVMITLGLMILFPLLVGEESATLGERTYKCFTLVHEKVLSELVFLWQTFWSNACTCEASRSHHDFPGAPLNLMHLYNISYRSHTGSWFCQCVSS